MEMRITCYEVTEEEQQCSWIKVTPEFPLFFKNTRSLVGGMREAAMFGIRLERHWYLSFQSREVGEGGLTHYASRLH